MDAERQYRGSGFWWRAAEPIPARPQFSDSAAQVTALGQGDDAALLPLNRPAAIAEPASGHPARRLSAAPMALGAALQRPVCVAPLGPAPPPISLDPPQRLSPGEGGIVAAPGARKRPGRSRMALLAAGLGGALVFAGATGFGRAVQPVTPLPEQLDRAFANVGFAIAEVSVSGHQQTLESEVFRALGPLDKTLLRFGVEAARERIEALPWVETATLTRVLPDKLKIEIRERRPFAIWLFDGRAALIDRSGRVLEKLGAHRPAGLPQIAGLGAPEAAADGLAALARHEQLASRVGVLHRMGGRRWDIAFESGPRVRLPAGDLKASLLRLERLNRESGILALAGQVVDLRHPVRVAIGPAPAPARTTGVMPSTASASRPSQPASRPAEPL